VEAVRTEPSAAAVTVEAVEVEFEVLAAALVVAATAAAEVVEEACFFLGMGEEAARARREGERMVGEKRMFTV